MSKQPAHIVLITPGQPSSNPRLTKEALTLAENGFKVTVVYSFWAHWAEENDRLVIADHPGITWIKVGGDPFKQKWRYFFSRLRHKIFRIVARWFPNLYFLAVRAEMRTFDATVGAVMRLKPDLCIAHNLGALAVAGHVASKINCGIAFDAEDFHRGQVKPGSTEYRRAELIEDTHMRSLSYVTAASPLIADAYRKLYSCDPIVIDNVFSIRYCPESIGPPGKPLKIFWFSQTVGRGRGIEDVLLAAKRLPPDSYQISLLGLCSTEVKDYLLEIARISDDQRIHLTFIDPVNQDELFDICKQYDVGLALETFVDENRLIALTNKIFTYLISGLSVVFSSTPAQERFYKENPGIGDIYKSGDIDRLEKILKNHISNPHHLAEQKANALRIAREIYNWENYASILISTVKKSIA